MFRLLEKLFIKDTEPQKTRQKYGVLCGTIGIVCNLLLCAFKLLAGALSGSVAIVADAMNNLSDAGSSGITLLGFRMAGKKPDKDHPFGHGRMEYLTGMFVSVMVILLGVELGKSSFSQLTDPGPIVSGVIAVTILVVSIPVKLYLFFVNRSVAKRIDSAALRATSIDCITDAAATTVTLVSLLLSSVVDFPFDGICGLGLAALILVSGIRSLLDTINPLLGQAPEAEFVASIRSIVSSYGQILGIHDLIVHDYGPGRRMVSFHAEVSSESDLMDAHDAIDNLENCLMAELGCHAVIHMDPIVVCDEKINGIKCCLNEIVKEIDREMSVHDVRMVEGPTHVNVVFDLVIPHRLTKEKKEIEMTVRAKIAERYPGYRAVMKIEHSYLAGEDEKGNDRV